MLNQKLVREFILLRLLSARSHDIYESMIDIRPEMQDTEALNGIRQAVEWGWTIVDIADIRLLPQKKELVINAEAIITFFLATLFSQDLFADEPYTAEAMTNLHSLWKLAVERTGFRLLRLSVAAFTELQLVALTDEEALAAITEAEALVEMDFEQVKEHLDSWEPVSGRNETSRNSRNDEWRKQFESGKSVKDIIDDWRQKTGERVTNGAVRQAIYRARNKKLR